MTTSRQLFDCFTFFNELDILELRLRTLEPYVSRFVVVEATTTFRGTAKPLYFAEARDRFRPFLDRIIHVVVDDMPLSDDPWLAERHQRDAIARGLGDAEPDDLILVSDVDEIPKPAALSDSLATAPGAITIFSKDEHNFRLNLRVRTQHSRWGGPRMIEMRHFQSGERLRRVRGIRSKSLDPRFEAIAWHLDTRWRHGAWLRRILYPRGAWHFSFVMDSADVALKLQAFSHEEYCTADTLDPKLLPARIAERKSFFGDQLELVGLCTLPAPVQEDPRRWDHILAATGTKPADSQA